jgi:hypothetical protein
MESVCGILSAHCSKPLLCRFEGTDLSRQVHEITISYKQTLSKNEVKINYYFLFDMF